MHFSGTFVIKDYQNKLESTSTFSYKVVLYSTQEVGNLNNVANKLSGLFKTQETVPTDIFTTTITKLNKATKEKVLVSEGTGSYFGQIYLDGKK